MPSPIPLLEEWKLLKQLARRPSFDPPHDLVRRHRRWCRHQYVDMVLAHYTFQNLYFERFACLANQIPPLLCHIAFQNLIPVLGYPHKVILNIVRRMAIVPILHCRLRNCKCSLPSMIDNAVDLNPLQRERVG